MLSSEAEMRRQPARHHRRSCRRCVHRENAHAPGAAAAALCLPTPEPWRAPHAPAPRNGPARARILVEQLLRVPPRSVPRRRSDLAAGARKGRLDHQVFQMLQHVAQRLLLAAPPGGHRRHFQILAQQLLAQARAETPRRPAIPPVPSPARWRPAHVPERTACTRPGTPSMESPRSSSGSQK